MTFDAKFFDAGVDRLGTASEKWDAMQAKYGSDVLPMWVADMDFRCPPAVGEAIRARASRDAFGYTEETAEDTAALVNFWQRRHALTIDPESVLMLPCVVTGLNLAVRCFTQRNQSVIVQPPVYGPFFGAQANNDRTLMKAPLVRDEQNRYHMDLSALENALMAGGKLLLLCNPHNPVGRAWTRQELSDMLALCARHDAIIVSDEIHADFVYPDRVHVSLLSLPGAAERTIMLCAASKTFNIAGLRQASRVVPNPALRDKLRQEIAAAGVVSGNLFALVGTRAAYEQGDAWLDGLRAYLIESWRIASEYMSEHLPHIACTPMESSFLMWLDCRALGVDSAELTRRTRQIARVELSNGCFFGEEGEGFLRLNLGCPHAQLKDALERLSVALKL